MKAAQIENYGDASAAHIVDIKKPTITPDQVLVRVQAASLNPFDTIVREGYLQESIPLQLPVTLGGDIAGEVVEVGTNVQNFAVGDQVYGQANVVAGNSGAFAEFAATSAAQIAKAPQGLTPAEAAALPLVGVSALQALVQHIQLGKDQKILITGGAGGIGRIAIQFAKYLGAYVATTVTGEGIEAAQKLGADEIIDYKTQDFAQLLHEYDAVFDTVGGPDFNKTLDILTPGSIAVTMSGQPDESKAQELGITAIAQFTKVTTEALDKLREFVEDGFITPHIAQEFSLDQIQEAFKARESGTVSGKIVLTIQ